jgi:hypothetical protein
MQVIMNLINNQKRVNQVYNRQKIQKRFENILFNKFRNIYVYK